VPKIGRAFSPDKREKPAVHRRLGVGWRKAEPTIFVISGSEKRRNAGVCFRKAARQQKKTSVPNVKTPLKEKENERLRKEPRKSRGRDYRGGGVEKTRQVEGKNSGHRKKRIK